MLRDRILNDQLLLNGLLRRILRELHVQYGRGVTEWFRALFAELPPTIRVRATVPVLLRFRLDRSRAALVALLERLVLRYVEVGAAESIAQLARGGMEESIGSAEQWFNVQKQADQQRPRRVRAQARGLVQLPVERIVELVVQQAELAIQAATAADEPLQVLLRRVEERAAAHWWRVARVTRTAVTWAFNDTRAQAVEVASIPQAWLRWTELVDDATGLPLDDRVAEDSLALHAQVARPGDLFTLPPDPKVDKKLWLQRWAHPPNRPNDRAVLTLWVPGRGVPAWRWEAGARVPVQ